MFRPAGSVGRALFAALVAVGGLAYAVAQEGGDTTVDVIQVEPMGEQTARAESLSPQEQAKAADSAVERAEASCAAQARALQSARKEDDIILVTCLEDKLSQCDVSLQNIKRRQAALDQAIAEGDSGLRNHEFTVIGVLSQKFSMLAQAANQCVGQDLFDTGETQVREQVDLFAPDEDPAVVTAVPEWPIPFIPPPVSGVN
jgi:hypothetical protein